MQFDDAKVDLRELGRIGNFTTAEYWKAVKHTKEQEALFKLLVKRLGDKDEQIQLQTAHFLSLLNDERSEPLIIKVRRQTDERRLSVARVRGIGEIWAAGPFDDVEKGFKQVHPPEKGPVDLSTEYAPHPGPRPKGKQGKKIRWRRMAAKRLYDFHKEFGPCDGQSFYAHFRLHSAKKQRINLLVGSDDGVKVWHNGREVWTNDIRRGALPFQDVVSVVLEPGSNDFLVRARNREGSCGIYLHFRSLTEVAATLPDKLAIESLAERLKNAKGVKYGEEFFKVDWAKAARMGDVVQGKKLFEALSCSKCHAADNNSEVIGGPSLAEASKRFTVQHLVESILLPSKQVSPVFQSTAIVTKDGRQITGLIIGETGEKLELLLPDAKRKTILKADIDRRQLQNLSPMPQGVIKKPKELRDVLAFLLSDDSTQRRKE